MTIKKVNLSELTIGDAYVTGGSFQTNAGTFNGNWYQATATDKDGNEYTVKWTGGIDWDAEDESNACNWDSPDYIFDENGYECEFDEGEEEEGPTMTNNYKPIKEGERYTIGEWDEGYKAYIINDGIYGYYWWGTEEDAQAAADAYNEYEGQEWLGQHGYGNDTLDTDELDDYDPDMVELYRLFGAIN